MYQKFRDIVVSNLAWMDVDTLGVVTKAMDIAADRFEFAMKSTALIPYGDDMPEVAKTYLVVRKIEGLSSGTLGLYKRQLEKFFKLCNKPIDKITPNDIRIFLYKYQNNRDVSNRTLDGYRAALSAFFKWCSSEGYISSDPTATVGKIKYTSKRKEALSQLELEVIRHNCETLREKAIVEFLFSTGCRVSEAASVKMSDIDWANNKINVLGKGNKYRDVYLNAKAIVAINAYIKSRTDNTDALFVCSKKPNRPLSVSAIERSITKISDRCGINKCVTPHIFRHTFATVMSQYAPIQDVSKAMGHTSVSTTMIYADISESNIIQEHQKYVV